MKGSKPKILIIGAGIAGLSLAAFLKNKKFEISIIDKVKEWKPRGGGITLMMNGTKALQDLGVYKKIKGIGNIIEKICITNQKNIILSEFNLGKYRKKYPPVVSIIRSHLHEILRKEIPNEKLFLNTKVKTIYRSRHGFKAIFNNGIESEYNLIVISDGINSDTRALIFPESKLSFAGYCCWRFLIKSNRQIQITEATEMWGKGKRFGIVPLGNDTFHCFASVNSKINNTYLKNISLVDFKKLFEEFETPASLLISQLLNKNQLIYDELGDVIVKKSIQENAILIGDAAHGMTPNITQGASLAVEDAQELSIQLLKDISINKALNNFHSIRNKRLVSLRKRSNLLGKIGQVENRFIIKIRNFIWKNIPNKWVQKSFEKIILNHGDK